MPNENSDYSEYYERNYLLSNRKMSKDLKIIIDHNSPNIDFHFKQVENKKNSENEIKNSDSNLGSDYNLYNNNLYNKRFSSIQNTPKDKNFLHLKPISRKSSAKSISNTDFSFYKSTIQNLKSQIKDLNSDKEKLVKDNKIFIEVIKQYEDNFRDKDLIINKLREDLVKSKKG